MTVRIGYRGVCTHNGNPRGRRAVPVSSTPGTSEPFTDAQMVMLRGHCADVTASGACCPPAGTTPPASTDGKEGGSAGTQFDQNLLSQMWQNFTGGGSAPSFPQNAYQAVAQGFNDAKAQLGFGTPQGQWGVPQGQWGASQGQWGASQGQYGGKGGYSGGQQYPQQYPQQGQNYMTNQGGGEPGQGYEPPPPQSNALPIALGIGAVLVVGGVVVWLVVRKKDE